MLGAIRHFLRFSKVRKSLSLDDMLKISECVSCCVVVIYYLCIASCFIFYIYIYMYIYIYIYIYIYNAHLASVRFEHSVCRGSLMTIYIYI